MRLFLVPWHEIRTISSETMADDEVSKERDGFESCLKVN